MSNRQLARGTLASGIVSILKICIQLVMLQLMARLVGPADYGLFGLAMPTVNLILILADSGFGISLAREPESNVHIWSTATWFLIGIGFALAGTAVVWSLIQAPLVNQPRLPLIMTALAVCPVLLALTVPANARLVRQGQLTTISTLELVAILAGGAAGIILAILEAGVWSLVAQIIVYWVSKAILFNAASPFLPRFLFSAQDLRPHLKIGGLILGGKLFDTGGRTVEVSLISRSLGASAVGAYTFANQLPRFLTEAMGNSLWAMLYAYALRTEDLPSVLRVYRLATRVFAVTIFPAVVLISVAAKPLLDAMLGPRWDAAIPILQILLITQAFNSLGGIGAAALYANGRAQVPFRISIEGVVLRIAVVASVPWTGFVWMAVGLGLVDIFLGCRSIFCASYAMGGRPLDMFANVAFPAVASAAGGFFCWKLVQSDFNPFGLPSFAATVLCMFLGFLIYVGLLALFEGRKVVSEGKTIYNLFRSQS